MATEKLRALIQYAKSIGMQILTMKQLYQMMNKDEPVILEEAAMTITATGTGAGVATFSVRVREDTLFTLDGNGKFYTNSAATEGESSTWECLNIGNTQRTIYIKCTSGVSNLKFTKRNLYRINYLSGSNAPGLGGDIGQFDDINYIHIEGNNTVNGDISNYINLTRLLVLGANTISGDISELTKLNYLHVDGSNNIS